MLRSGTGLAAMVVAFGLAPSAGAQEPAGEPKPAPGPERPDHRHEGAYKGRPIADVMSFTGADWLVRPERIEEEQPERMLDALDIRPGMVVADVGAGVGYHSLRMARRVGPEGTVIATDVQPQMLRMLRSNARQARVRNIKTVLCTQDETGLPAAAVDLVLMVDVYHECSDPEATIDGILAALKPGGRLVLVEFRAEDPDVPIKPEHKMAVEQVRLEIEPRGLAFKEVLDFLPWQHIIIFEKPAAPPGGPAPGAEADPIP